jgi:hypothetical protein
MRYPGRSVRNALVVPDCPGSGGEMTALLAAVWLLLDYPWGLLTFVALATLYGRVMAGPSKVTARAGYF